MHHAWGPAPIPSNAPPRTALAVLLPFRRHHGTIHGTPWDMPWDYISICVLVHLLGILSSLRYCPAKKNRSTWHKDTHVHHGTGACLRLCCFALLFSWSREPSRPTKHFAMSYYFLVCVTTEVSSQERQLLNAHSPLLYLKNHASA